MRTATTDTFSRFTSPEPGNSPLSWCHAEGYRDARPAPNPVGSAEEEPKGLCCCCYCCNSPGGNMIFFLLKNILTESNFIQKNITSELNRQL